jgi:redox-sensitive bicupin YhaK (pirin superfamily)
VYSGASGEKRSPARNHVPVTLAEITMKAGASVEQDIPASYNGFLYVIAGAARVGTDATLLKGGQVGWLDRPEDHGLSLLRIVAGDEGARLVLYAGQPLGDPIVSHGPFIGDSRQDIERLYGEYRDGRFERMSQLARAAHANDHSSGRN